MAELRTSGETLRQAIERAGYYPGLVSDALETALAGEAVRSFVVHHEPHFDREELRRHVSVLVLTPTRLVVGHSTTTPRMRPPRSRTPPCRPRPFRCAG